VDEAGPAFEAGQRQPVLVAGRRAGLLHRGPQLLGMVVDAPQAIREHRQCRADGREDEGRRDRQLDRVGGVGLQEEGYRARAGKCRARRGRA
jgi:hypothetical protein